MAEDILEEIVEQLETKNNGVKVNKTLYVLRRTQMPAMLIELAFITNAKDAENYGEITLDMYIERSNYTLYRTLGKLLTNHVPLYKIPEILQQRAYNDTCVNHRNFESFFCL